MRKLVVMCCMVLLFVSHSVNGYTISSGGEEIYTIINSVIYQSYSIEEEGSSLFVIEFELYGKIWSDLIKNTTLTFHECDLAGKIVPLFDNIAVNNFVVDISPIDPEFCPSGSPIIITPELNNFVGEGYLIFDTTLITVIPDGIYDLSFQIQGIPSENNGHSDLIISPNADDRIDQEPYPQGWGIETKVSFDLNFPYYILISSIIIISVIRRSVNKN